MIIYNYKGEEMAEHPNYELGRLIEIDGRVTFVLWDEVPQGTGEGKAAGEPLPPEPSQIDRIQAQVDYTAVLTDTLLDKEA